VNFDDQFDIFSEAASAEQVYISRRQFELEMGYPTHPEASGVLVIAPGVRKHYVFISDVKDSSEISELERLYKL
jgi:hypothetical protein